MRIHAEAYLEYTYGSSNKFYSLALLENDDGSWSAAFNYGPINQPRGWGFKAANVSEDAARKAYGKTLRDKSDYDLKPAVAAYAQYPNAARPSGANAQAPVSAGGTGIDRAQPDDGGVPRFPAQLCAPRGTLELALARPAAFAVEEKFDGFRGLVAILPGGRFEIRNRDGISTGRIENTPRLVAALKALVARRPSLAAGTLLDGELVGKSWAETASLLSRSGGSEAGLRYVIFDVPFLEGRDLRAQPFSARRAELEKLAPAFDGSTLVLSKLLTPVANLAETIWAAGGEGLIIKDRSARYIPGDRRAWAKIKEVNTAEGVILGYDAGKVGKYSDTTGAVRIGQYRNGELVQVCAISGMTDDVRRSLDDRVVGKVVEFAYHQRTAESYRHPRWLRQRDDKRPEDCTW